MPRPRRRYTLKARFNFLFHGEVERVVTPRPSRARAKAGRKQIEKIEAQYNNMDPIN